MTDTVSDIIEGMRDMRIRHALLITAIKKLGGELSVTRADVYASAAHDILCDDSGDQITLKLKPAPEPKKEQRHGTHSQASDRPTVYRAVKRGIPQW